MDIADDLQYSYLEQSFMQINKLRNELLRDEDDGYREEQRKAANQRMFRHNIFEDIDSTERQCLEQALCRSLKSIGIQLNHNLDPANAEKKMFQVVDKRCMKNYVYDSLGVIHLKSKDCVKLSTILPKKQALMLHVVAKILNLLQTGRYMTNRELYYKSQELCKSSPSKLVSVIDDLSCLLGCSRIHLHILCQTKGIIYGDLKFTLKTGQVIDCLSDKWGVKLPNPDTPIVDINSNSKFVIVIEKDSVLQKILSQESSTNFVKKYKAILFTAKGYPDINSRAFVHLLWTKLKIPIFALTDADPHGLEIVCCYKFGCYSTASEATCLAVPHIRWLGLLPGDVIKHSLSQATTSSLTDNDTRKISSLMRRPYLQKKPDWMNQLRMLSESKRKAELESIDIEGDYLVKTYLPNKLRYASWL